MLEGVEATANLDEARRVALFNQLEAIKVTLGAAASDRLICERVKPVGSNGPRNVCLTAAERGASRDAARTTIQTRDTMQSGDVR